MNRVISSPRQSSCSGFHSLLLVFFVAAFLAPAARAATFTVNTADDELNTPSGAALSLREALRDAAAAAAPDTIVFAPALNGKTIILGNEIAVEDADGVTVDASALPAGLTIDGGPGTNRIFYVWNPSPAPLTLRGLTLTGGNGTGDVANIDGYGGAILHRGIGTLTLIRCTLHHNSGGFGGGIFAESGGSLVLTQCTLSGNAVSGTGGAIAVGWDATLTQCTISGNSAPVLGAGMEVLSGSTTTLDRCIISGNTGSADLHVAGTLTREGTSIVPIVSGSGGFNGTGTISSADPLLAPLANNGGPTKTHALLPGSPALDAGDGSLFTTDQRGQPLVGDADIGAFEVQAGGIFVLRAPTYAVAEGQPLTVTVQRGDFLGAASVRLFTTAGTATAADFTGRANTAASDIAFANGENTKDVIIPTTLDLIAEGNHSFTLALGSLTPAPPATLGTPASATVNIKDSIVVTNVNDDGPGSLRQALATAALNLDPATVGFAPGLNGKTIVLGSEIVVADAGGVTVDASNLPAGITIDGGPGTNRIFFVGNAPATTLTLRCLTLTGGNGTGTTNPSLDGVGGGIFNAGALTLERCTVTGNAPIGFGYGGGIFNNGALTLTQCTLSNNTAGQDGGAIFNDSTMIMTQCTVFDGHAGNSGGGIYNTNFATTRLNRCIAAGNFSGGTFPADVINVGTVTVDGTSVVPAFHDFGTVNGTGSINTSDPLLVPLAANGGPTRTHALLPGSPALDTGDGSLLITDQRGRPVVGDPDIGAFEVQMGGVFVLSGTGYSVGENAGTSPVVTVQRTGAFLGAASVRISTTPGSATIADYATVTNQVVNFSDGTTSMPVSLTITNDSTVEANESFTVTLNGPSAGTSLGAPASAKVAIIDPSSLTATPVTGDPTLPGVPTITTPAANAVVNVDANTGGSITVTGTAKDNKGVKQVVASLNGGAPVLLTLTHPGATSTTFTGSVSGAVSGVNTLSITASDFVAGHNTNSSVRLFKVLRPLHVNVAGFGSVTTGYVPKSFREVGAPQKITATAGTGYFFAGWTVLSGHSLDQLGVSAAALEKATLTFIHREGLVPRATFVPNPFVASVTGTYNGGVTPYGSTPPGGTPSRLDSEGYLTALVQRTGAFSGSLKIDGLTLAIAGAFDHLGVARFGTSRATSLSVARAGKPSLSLMLNIALAGPRKITGTVAQFGGLSLAAVSIVDADRAVFSSANPVPTDPYLTVTGGTATYTTIFLPAGGGGLGTDQFPQGRGYGTVTLSKTGVITVAGRLADNTAISQSTTMSQFGRWRLFIQLYRGRQGVLAGNVQFDHPNPASDFSASEVRWFCPILDRQHYPLGWPTGIEVDVRGAKYIVTVGSSVVPGDPGSNASLEFINGLLTGFVSKSLVISTADVVTELPVPDPGYSLTINRATGVISGTFLHSDDTRPVFNGIVFQKVNGPLGFPNFEGAHGFFLTTTPTVKTYNGQSGMVFLHRP